MQYPGGKGKSFQHIINVLPPHTTYIETHLGAGAVLRHKAPAAESIGIEIDVRVIEWWHIHHPGLATYIAGDAVEILRKYEFRGTEVVYCDPPYLPSVRKRQRVYRHDLAEEDHLQLLSILKELPCHVAISGYPSQLYRKELCDWTELQFLAKAHDGRRLECIWINYEVPKQLHDTRFLGANFRQRQDVKRRMHRLQTRISHLSGPEQHMLAEWLSKHLHENNGAG